jgi:hypothetical protein
VLQTFGRGERGCRRRSRLWDGRRLERRIAAGQLAHLLHDEKQSSAGVRSA